MWQRRGQTVADLRGAGQPVAAGVDTAPALVTRAKQAGIELPLAEAMADLISGALPLAEALSRLMSRRLTSE